MLNICDSFATSHGLVFNAQLICFRRCHTLSNIPTISFTLPFLKEVTHLGHILTYDLDHKPDIIRAVKDMNRKANSVLCRFSALDPCFLIKTYCLSLYGCSLWSLSSPSIRIIEVAFNKLLRKIWNLPYNSHTGILCIVLRRFILFQICYMIVFALYIPLLSPHLPLLYSQSLSLQHSIFIHLLVIYIHGYTHYYFEEFHAAFIIKCLRSTYGIHSPCENIVQFVSCS